MAEPPLAGSWLASDRKIPRYFARPVRRFLHTEAAGGLVLLVAAAVALVLANSPLADGFERVWRTEAGFEIGSLSLREDLRHWTNDALMTIFFFVVGLEIKRELVVGELNERRKAALPAIAALGGMAVPALLYLAFNRSGDASNGWGIPMATDIAFAVGVLALLSKRVPPGLKVFLLSLAIVDDIGAIPVIALFYSDQLHTGWLLAAASLVGVIVLLRAASVKWVPVYVAVGSFVWLATFESGVHATIAGVLLGLLTPARPADPGGFQDVASGAAGLEEEPDAESLRAIHMEAQETVSVAERLEHVLHPWTSYVVIPLFALANAGVALSAGSLGQAVGSTVTIGIIVGLPLGTIVGISLFSWLAVKLRVGVLPEGVTKRHLLRGRCRRDRVHRLDLYQRTCIR